MKVFFVIPVHNRVSHTLRCLGSLDNFEGYDTHVIVVDDGSTDNTAEIILRAFPDVTVLRGDGNLFWTGAVKLGVGEAVARSKDGDWIVLMNNDAVVEDAMILDKLVAVAEWRDRRALVAPITVSRKEGAPVTSGTQFVSKCFGLTRHIKGGRSDEHSKSRLVQADLMTARFLLHPVEIFKAIDYRPNLFPHYGGDDDFSLQAKRLGYDLLVDRSVSVSLDTSRQSDHKISALRFNERFRFHCFDRRSSVNIPDRVRFASEWISMPCRAIYIVQSIIKSILVSLYRAVS